MIDTNGIPKADLDSYAYDGEFAEYDHSTGYGIEEYYANEGAASAWASEKEHHSYSIDYSNYTEESDTCKYEPLRLLLLIPF